MSGKSKAQNLKNGNIGNDACRKNLDPSYQFLKILNMGSVSSKRHEMDILEDSNSVKGIPPTRPPTPLRFRFPPLRQPNPWETPADPQNCALWKSCTYCTSWTYFTVPYILRLHALFGVRTWGVALWYPRVTTCSLYSLFNELELSISERFVCCATWQWTDTIYVSDPLESLHYGNRV